MTNFDLIEIAYHPQNTTSHIGYVLFYPDALYEYSGTATRGKTTIALIGRESNNETNRARGVFKTTGDTTSTGIYFGPCGIIAVQGLTGQTSSNDCIPISVNGIKIG